MTLKSSGISKDALGVENPSFGLGFPEITNL
jgi:hypothetical protein